MREATFYFYDLETSGFSPRDQRIMQFGGQRTDLQLKPIGEPQNQLIKLSEDILPDPTAVLLTGITPQMTVADGITEAEFLKIFYTQIATPNTIFVGFNNIRFDDEFIRFLNYRNFCDAYEWHWSDGRSRWDLLDVVRMTRALRPDGIEWPFDNSGVPANRLELLTALNGLRHETAHDALSDVHATIALAQLLRQKQPKLFDHLLQYRDKKLVATLVNAGQPFTYTSGKYSSQFLHTTAAVALGAHPKNHGVIVFDLRYDPAELLSISSADLIERWQHRCQEHPCPHPRVPLKTMQFNRCPSVAPLGVIDKDSQKRLDLNLKQITNNFSEFLKVQDKLYDKILNVLSQMDQEQTQKFTNDKHVETMLYDNFIPDEDKQLSHKLVASKPDALSDFMGKFHDKRLNSMLPLYISKNFPKQQTDEIRQHFEKYKQHKLLKTGKFDQYFTEIEEGLAMPKITSERKFLLEELRLWGERVLPQG